MRANSRRFQRIIGKPSQQDRAQSRGQEDINLPLHSVVYLDDALRRLLFILAVLHQQSSDSRAQGRLPRLQRNLDLRSRIFFFALACQSEHTIDRIPELRERTAQRGALLARAASRGQAAFQTHGIIQIGVDALKLRRPGGERIGFVVVDHIPHGHGEQV